MQIFGERKKARAWSPLWKKCLSPYCIYTPFKCKRGVWMLDQGCPYPPFRLSLGWFLFPFSPRIGRTNTNFLLGFTMLLSIQKSAATNMALPIQNKSAANNCADVDSEIGNKTTPLLIQKSATKNCIVANSVISKQKLCRCRFRNRQQNCVAADSEIGSQLSRCRFRNWQRWWSHFGFTSSFFLVFTLLI